MKKWIYLLSISFIFTAIYAIPYLKNGGKIEAYKKRPFHGGFDLTEAENTLFLTAGKCENCHGLGSLGPNAEANQDADGNDISPVNLWRSTMMANAATDPFWQAKVSHEKLVNPDLSAEIEGVCIKCHAPLGKFNALHHSVPYSLDSMRSDPLGMDGVSCLGCHSMKADNLGNIFSAGMTYDTTHTIYGQYSDPVSGPMISNIGFTPVFGEHISSSEACGACHTLITNPVDEFGVDLDTFFVEQAIYHEWLNSDFSVENETCQDCHMPRTDFNVTIANRPPWLDSRPDFAKHDLVGANVFMLNILADNIDTLHLTASTSEFELTIEKTLDMLQNKSMSSTLEIFEEDTDSITYSYHVKNLAGHKLPGGYPSRRLIVEFLVQTRTGDTIFHSGKFNEDYTIVEEDFPFENHHNIIRAEEDIQIYEMVMGDYYGDFTTVLESSYANLKDNRLVPKGFSTAHTAYDTVRIVGLAEIDANFNDGNAGDDIIYYKIPKTADTDSWVITARVYYQTVSKKWLADMFSYSSDEIDLFKYLYDNADVKPTLINEARINGFSGMEKEEIKLDISIFPNPTKDRINIASSEVIKDIKIYSISSELVYSFAPNSKSFSLDFPQLNGMFLLSIKFDNGSETVRTIVFD